MTELKTLKDLDEGQGFTFDNVADYKEELRAEAIKWYKERIASHQNCSIKADWKHFFNITEEDLK